ncbi:MAG TPA: SDR family NAD(P)-dependent oxidoreductase, partial [Solirubrobacteraceae bacterium]
RGQGTIVNVASLLAFAGARPPGPLPVRATYAGTKGFVVAFTRTLAAELADTPVRVQVLCPGYTKTEFHMSNGTDPIEGTPPDIHPPIAMEAEHVVEASLQALGTGELVCAPGLDDPTAIDRLVAAEAEILTADRATPAARYAQT